MNSSFRIDVGFIVPPGITVLFGPSGAGKSTILRIIAGIEDPDRGAIALPPLQLFDSDSSINVPAHQRRIGFVFQDLALFPHLTALQNVQYGLQKLSSSEQRDRSMSLLSRFKVSEAADRKPAQLSGGERQRVALARTLATNPAALLLDEPLSALDANIKAAILDDLVRWVKENPIPVLYVTHDHDELYSVADQVVILSQGEITHVGAPAAVLNSARAFRKSRTEDYENLLWATAHLQDPVAGTMSCDVGGALVEAPMPHGEVPARFQIAISAGDILLSIHPPEGISARNVLQGEVTGITRLGHSVAVSVRCGTSTLISHVTPNALHSLGIAVGKRIWLVFKTHSCHILRE